MGTVAFTRGVRDGYVRDLEHPDHPLGGDDVTAARGQLRVVFDRRTNLLLSSDVDSQDGTPLTFNKVLAVKPGFHVRQPARSPRSASLGARLESHAAIRRERAADDGPHAIHHPDQPDSVSNAGLRVLRGCRHHRTQPGHDAPARVAASAVGGDHDIAPAAQADVGRRCISLRRSRSPVLLGRSAGSTNSRFGSTRVSTRPAARCSDRRPSD